MCDQRGLDDQGDRDVIAGRTYLEHGKLVVVLIQWGLKSRGESHGGPRNVLVERADGTRVVRPFRGLRLPNR
jgi:hypothetical protein